MRLLLEDFAKNIIKIDNEIQIFVQNLLEYWRCSETLEFIAYSSKWKYSTRWLSFGVIFNKNPEKKNNAHPTCWPLTSLQERELWPWHESHDLVLFPGRLAPQLFWLWRTFKIPRRWHFELASGRRPQVLPAEEYLLWVRERLGWFGRRVHRGQTWPGSEITTGSRCYFASIAKEWREWQPTENAKSTPCS